MNPHPNQSNKDFLQDLLEQYAAVVEEAVANLPAPVVSKLTEQLASMSPHVLHRKIPELSACMRVILHALKYKPQGIVADGALEDVQLLRLIEELTDKEVETLLMEALAYCLTTTRFAPNTFLGCYSWWLQVRTYNRLAFTYSTKPEIAKFWGYPQDYLSFLLGVLGNSPKAPMPYPPPINPE